MIDHLVEKYGVDPNGADVSMGGLPSTRQRGRGRVRTVKHLVEKHNVDIHKRDVYAEGRLLWTWQRSGAGRSAPPYLRGYGSHERG